MIEIKPVKTLDECKGLIDVADTSENMFILAAKDGLNVLGAGILKMHEVSAEIVDIKVDDKYNMPEIDYSIGKALLNFIERRSVFDVICKNGKMDKLLLRLKFKKISENLYELNLVNYFSTNC